jgi:hypothetical protein
MKNKQEDLKSSKGKCGRLVQYLSLLTIFVFGIISVIATRIPTPPPIEIKKVYILGFAENGSDRIRVRYSEDGQTWLDGKFPDAATSFGVGGTSTIQGAMNIIFWTDSSNKVECIWGLGTEIWDTRPTGPALDQKAFSSPSAADIGDNLYLVAFRTQEDQVSLRVLNSSSRRWLSISLAPANALNSDVWSRPAITVLNGTILLAWYRSDFSVAIAKGNVVVTSVGSEKIPVIDWTNIYQFSTTESGYGAPVSQAALTHDGNNFHLGFARMTLGGPLQRADLFVYSSADGVSWGSSTKKVGIPLVPRIDIAARSDGSIVAAVVGPPTHRSLYKYSGGSWTTILESHSTSPDSIFGWVPNGNREIVLFSNKLQ